MELIVFFPYFYLYRVFRDL